MQFSQTDAYKFFLNSKNSLKYKNRYFNPDIDKLLLIFDQFLALKTSKILKTKQLWRAQLGFDEEAFKKNVLSPHTVNRMFPNVNFSRAGRANSYGINYLYAATDQETAITEVRPYINSLVSVAQLSPKDDLTVVNLCNDNTSKLDCITNSNIQFNQAIWHLLSYEFSRPTNPEDSILEYLLTQIATEYFKNKNFDGIIFNSSMNNNGRNVVIFNKEKLKIITRNLVQVKNVKWRFE